MRRAGVLTALWLAVAVLAMAGGTWALTLAGTSLGSGFSSLNGSEVDRALAEARSTATPPPPSEPTTAPSQAPTTSPPPTGEQRGLTTDAGRIVAACRNGQVTLVSWSPKPGYRDDHVNAGPAEVAQIEFESDVADDVTVTVRCQNGQPVASSVAEPDDHGGGDDHGGDDDGDDDNSGRGS